MCATQQTHIQTEYLDLQLSTAVVGAEAQAQNVLVLHGLESMLNQVVLMGRRGLLTPQLDPAPLPLQIHKSSGTAVDDNKQLLLWSYCYVQEEQIANLSVLFQLCIQRQEVWVDIHVTENKQSLKQTISQLPFDPTECEAPSSVSKWTHKVTVMLSLNVPLCIMGYRTHASVYTVYSKFSAPCL